MKKTIGFLLTFPVLLWAAVPAAVADTSAISTMAEIVMHLNHYPSDSEKQTLARIVHNEHATAGEKALAGALIRMRHSVGGSDAAALRELASDTHATKQERELADVLLGITHHPSASDRQRLQSLLGSSAGGKASHRRRGSWGY